MRHENPLKLTLNPAIPTNNV